MLHLWIQRQSGAEEASTPGHQSEFSAERFDPMARLLSEEDFQFLKSQPGYSPEVGKKFVRERKRIFRLYLGELVQEFRRLHADARAMVATLPSEHSALVGVLLRQQVQFWYQVTTIELRLSLGAMGMGSRSDAQGLIESISRMHNELIQLAATSAA